MENVNVKDHLLAMAMQSMKPGVRPAGGKGSGKKDDMFNTLFNEAKAQAKPVEQKPADKKPIDKKPADKPVDKPAETKPAQDPKEEAPVTGTEVEQQMLLAAMTVVVTPATVVAEPDTVEPELQIVTAAPESDLVEQTAVKPQTVGVEAPVLTEGAESAEPQTVLKADQTEPEFELQPVEHQKMEAPKDELDLEDMDVTVKTAEGMEAAEQPLFEEVESVPIKVGDAPKDELADAVPVHDQLKGRLEEAIRGGESRLELELEPRSLGRVVIEMTMQKDGAMHILLRASKPSTQLLLDSDAGKLQGILGRDTRQEVFVETANFHEEKQMPQYRQEPQDQGRERQQQEERRPRKHEESGEDFMHQLRLGLTPVYND